MYVQGKCRWRSPSGKTITLESTNALALSELERSTLVEVALEKLKSINLGVEVKLPKEKAASGATTKKRRPYLLKKKALSTGFFEGGKRDEKGKAILISQSSSHHPSGFVCCVFASFSMLYFFWLGANDYTLFAYFYLPTARPP